MRLLAKAAAAAGLMLIATPCLAFTIVQAPGSNSGKSEFVSPEASLASKGAAIQNSMVDRSLRARNEAGFNSIPSTYGSSGQSYNFGPLSVTSQIYDQRYTPGYGYGAFGQERPYSPLVSPYVGMGRR